MTALLEMLAPTSEEDLSRLIAERRDPLRIIGGGTRVEHPGGDRLSTANLSGVVTYSPGEMTLIARPGTPLPEIETMLADEGQALAFEPPDLRQVLGSNGTPTLGGMVASNASGPRRVMAGACRDHLLGVRFVDGQGRIIKNGGRVMKNVTGLDLSKLLAGSYGTLAVLTEVVLKTLPHLPARATLAFGGMDPTRAVQIFSTALATPFDVTGAAWRDGTAYLRVEGLERQLIYRRDRLLALLAEYRPDVLDDRQTVTLWRDLRDLAHFTDRASPLWRILTKPTEAPAICDRLRELDGTSSMDWGGGLIWYQGPGSAEQIRNLAPHATLIRRAGLSGPAFSPQSGPMARLQSGLRRSFDPHGILNPGLMDA